MFKSAPLIIDTNVLLDCFVFKDEHTLALHKAIETLNVKWFATHEMITEYIRVLEYPSVVRWKRKLSDTEILCLPSVFERFSILVDSPATHPKVRCRDQDDQMFIDLAIEHGGLLISKDHEVLKLNGKEGLTAISPSSIYEANL